MALALPESYSASIAFHVLGMSGWSRYSFLNPTDPLFMRTGQWIYNTNQFSFVCSKEKTQENNGWHEPLVTKLSTMCV